MIKIGKIRTVASIIPKAYEVIEIEGGLFAGKDAFLFPKNREDLRCLECLAIPSEWEWTERYVERDAPAGKPAVPKGKYRAVHGLPAREKIEEILTRHETGVLCLFDEKTPYAIPVNHAYRDGKLYIHSGKIGKKLNLIRRNPNASYCLYGNAAEVPKNVRSCHLEYESIVFTGTVRISADPQEKEEAVLELTNHYGTPYQHGFADMIEILVFEIGRATARTGRFKPRNERELFYYEFI